MKINLLFYLLLITFSTYSQSKTDKVEMISEGKINTFYKYDSLGRISQLQKSDDKFFSLYNYLGDTAIVIQRIAFLDTSLNDILLLNENKLVDFKTIIYADNVFLFVTNKYDSNNKLILQTVTSDVMKSSYEDKIENGNTIQQITLDTIYENGKFQIQKRILNSQFSTKINPLQKNVTGFIFESNENKNLLISESITFYKSDFCTELPCPFLPEKTEVLIYKYEYEFDSKGRIKKGISINTKTKEQSVKTYFYN